MVSFFIYHIHIIKYSLSHSLLLSATWWSCIWVYEMHEVPYTMLYALMCKVKNALIFCYNLTRQRLQMVAKGNDVLHSWKVLKPWLAVCAFVDTIQQLLTLVVPVHPHVVYSKQWGRKACSDMTNQEMNKMHLQIETILPSPFQNNLGFQKC